MSEIESLPPDPDEFMGPRRYRITCLCNRCGKTYSYVAARLSDPDKPCPKKKCKKAAAEEEIERRARNLAAMLAQQKAPGQVGANIGVKAIDETAKIVMEDYQMTDLKDDVRGGEPVAPKLPPHQQKLADGFFGGKAIAERWNLGSRQSRELTMIGKRALAGAFRNMAVNPGQIMAGKRGEPTLRPLRTEVINERRR